MKCYIVKFATQEDTEAKMYFLDEKKHNDWCMCEPPQGYKCFETLWEGYIEDIVLSDLGRRNFNIQSNTESITWTGNRHYWKSNEPIYHVGGIATCDKCHEYYPIYADNGAKCPKCYPTGVDLKTK